MPRQRFYNLRPEAREKLLRVAVHHFARHGFEKASLNEILKGAGLSKGVYYYYFEDKDDLFATVLESSVDEVLERFPIPNLAELGPETFWPTVERFVGQWAAAVEPSSDVVQAALSLTAAQRSAPRFAPLLSKAQVMYRKFIEAGRAIGCVRSDLPVDVLVRLLEVNDAALDAIFLARRKRVTKATIAAHAKLVFDTFKRLTLPDAKPAAARRLRRRAHG